MRTLLFVFAIAFMSTATASADTIVIHAAGDTGEEIIQLKIQNRVITQWELKEGNAKTGDFRTYQLDYPYPLRPIDIKVAFPNDGLNEQGEDKNVRIDKIEIKKQNHFGVSTYTYQTEHEDTYSTGTWSPETGCEPGYKESEYLHCGGEFHYRNRTSFTKSRFPMIRIDAAGATGYEAIELHYKGAPIARFNNIGGDADQAVYEKLEYFVGAGSGGKIPPITHYRVVFVNDGLTEDGRDMNVRVDGLSVIYPADPEDENAEDRIVKYESEDPETLTTGSWDPETGCTMGHKKTEWLACNGYFEYFGTQDLYLFDRVYEVRIAGTTGLENVVITQASTNPEVRGRVLKTFLGVGGSAYDQEYITLRYIDRGRQSSKPQFDPPIKIDDCQVAFINDGLTEDEDDKNVRVDWIRLLDYDGTELDFTQGESQRVFSTGTWKEEDGQVPGYRESEWLQCNGHMQVDSNE